MLNCVVLKVLTSSISTTNYRDYMGVTGDVNNCNICLNFRHDICIIFLKIYISPCGIRELFRLCLRLFVLIIL